MLKNACWAWKGCMCFPGSLSFSFQQGCALPLQHPSLRGGRWKQLSAQGNFKAALLMSQPQKEVCAVYCSMYSVAGHCVWCLRGSIAGAGWFCSGHLSPLLFPLVPVALWMDTVAWDILLTMSPEVVPAAAHHFGGLLKAQL